MISFLSSLATFLEPFEQVEADDGYLGEAPLRVKCPAANYYQSLIGIMRWMAEIGGIDIAINTVGMVLKKPFVETTEKEYDVMSDVNSKVAYFFIQEAGKKLNDNGKICSIVTSLLAAYTGYYSTYEGMKAPVEHFTRAASKEFGNRGISVTAVAPGPMDTPFFYGQEGEDAVAYHKSASALGGLTDIKDIAPLVEFLVSDGWWITGQTIFANGGYTTR